MKKIIYIILILLALMVLSSSKNPPYAKKCVKCIEYNQKQKSVYVDVGMAWRDFTTPTVHKDGKIYGVYKCPYGHKFLVYFDDEE